MEFPSQLGITPNTLPVNDTVSPITQNLFEAMASQAKDRHLSDLGQVGRLLAGHLDRYLDRTTSFSERVQQISKGAPTYTDAMPVEQTGVGHADQRVMTVLHSLNVMFDYSIETQMVVRSATQISGAVNTLMRGQ